MLNEGSVDDAGFILFDEPELLIGCITDGNHHPSHWGKLMDEGRGDFPCSGRHHDPVIWSVFLPAEMAVPMMEMDVGDPFRF